VRTALFESRTCSMTMGFGFPSAIVAAVMLA
jgi:hypothetical protein